MRFRDFDSAGFLRDCWQKRPMLIRDPWHAWVNPLEPNDLAGLACDDEMESRLIALARETWALEHGPFDEARFNQLGAVPWTLLVQAVDHAVPEVAALIAPFRFVPNWRIDDVMVSYATNGGGVGPHFDQYDVFLIQGLGQRRWQVGALCDDASPLLPHDDLRLLAAFEPTDEWLLGPGDVLYVPPGYAHNGVAVGDDCMTYSIGFRAPSRSELIENWCDDLLERLPDDDRYADPDLATQDNPGEISPAALARLHAMVTDRLLDRAAFARWFGRYTSARKYPELDWQPDELIGPDAVRALLAAGPSLERNPASRFAFVREPDGTLMLFVDGASFGCSEASAALAQELCAGDSVTLAPALAQSDAAVELIVLLVNAGSVTFRDED